jgi:hypothetical protein
MKRLVFAVVVVMAFATVSFAQQFQAVTPDDTVSNIGQVKVTEKYPIFAGDKAVLEKYGAKLPEDKMHRLEIIDKQLQEKQDSLNKITAEINEINTLREKVFKEASKVILKK